MINASTSAVSLEAEPPLDPTSRLVIEEARRRGISVQVLAARAEYFRLTFGPRSIVCRESLSELTHAVALSRCDDKRITSCLLRDAGLRVPEQVEASSEARNLEFLQKHGAVVVKPARGEQGRGISVGIGSATSLRSAITRAAAVCPVVLLEELIAGEDLRIIVMAGQVVAGAVRRPPQVVGDGRSTIRALIAAQSLRRSLATAGESKIPLDDETERCLVEAGHTLHEVLNVGATVTVRKTANVHTGGTIHDVTEQLHPALCSAACKAAETLDIPVVGLDMIVPSVDSEHYAILEANERPGLANHEPQPTAARFVDFLFPETI